MDPSIQLVFANLTLYLTYKRNAVEVGRERGRERVYRMNRGQHGEGVGGREIYVKE